MIKGWANDEFLLGVDIKSLNKQIVNVMNWIHCLINKKTIEILI